jgi:TatD DNase family protein
VEADIEDHLSHPKNVGIGEIGLDYHYDNSPRDVQIAVLKRQLQLAVRLKKQVTIHTCGFTALLVLAEHSERVQPRS